MAYSKHLIELEYDTAATAQEEFAKVKWGSQRSMLNRFHLAMRCIDFNKVERWLDVGCGTGAFQALVRTTYPDVTGVAIDLSSRLLDFARNRADTRGINFRLVDFLDLDGSLFDLITSIGVLQKTTMAPALFFQHAAKLLVPGGLLYIDTKHAGWKRFDEPGFLPEPNHEWFMLDALCKALTTAGFTLETAQGFLPDTGELVEASESHTIFCIARRACP